MASFEDVSFSFEQFSGKVRLFPLPNLVLFPHVMQPLHIYEPRYRKLLEDALSSDRLIAMAVLQPGWETDYDGRPPVYPVACLGRITTHHRLEDGTYNALVLGLRRVRLVRELESTRLYREAEVEICEDCDPPQSDGPLRGLQRRLREAFLKFVPMLPEAQEQLDHLLSGDVALGVLTDIISYMLDLAVPVKESLLAQVDVAVRAELLLEHLSAVQQLEESSTLDFPPQFSAN